MNSKLAYLFVIMVLGIGFFYLISKNHSNENISSSNHEEDFKKAQSFLDKEMPYEAIAIIKKNLISSKEEKKWASLLLKASQNIKDSLQLSVIYEYYPDLFDNNENAILSVADHYINTGKIEKYKELRDHWKNKIEQDEVWMNLDSDLLILEGKNYEALKLLKSRRFEGIKDVPRLIKLGLINSSKDPKQALKYFNFALEIDPTNHELRLLKAKFQENSGNLNHSLQEYYYALQVDPNSPYIKDQIAEFYMRNGQPLRAIHFWKDSLSAPSLENVWLKALFWNKVLIPFNFEWDKHTPPESSLKPLINYIISLKPYEFWNEEKFEKIPNNKKFLNTEQSTFWLKLLFYLSQGNDKKALKQLEYNPFHEKSWAPNLELALMRVLMYREKGTFLLGGLEGHMKKSVSTIGQNNLPHFYQILEDLAIQEAIENREPKISYENKSLLKSQDVYAALFLAEGWYEAALKLNTLNVLPENFPDWYLHALGKAYRTTHRPKEGLKFLNKQKKTPEVELQIAEFLLEDKQSKQALDILNKLSVLKQHNFRIARLKSLAYIEQGHLEKAKKYIESHSELIYNVTGQELLAKIALLENNEDVAFQIYTNIEEESHEARTYLAKKAYEDKDWERADRLTQRVLLDMPTNNK